MLFSPPEAAAARWEFPAARGAAGEFLGNGHPPELRVERPDRWGRNGGGALSTNEGETELVIPRF